MEGIEAKEREEQYRNEVFEFLDDVREHSNVFGTTDILMDTFEINRSNARIYIKEYLKQSKEE